MPRLSDDAIFNLAVAYERQAELEGRARKEKQGISKRICEELEGRGSKSLTAEDGTTVTRVQAENVIIDEKALYADLRPAQRRKVYRPSLNVSALPTEDQKALLAFLRERGLRNKITWNLDTSALSSEVQAGKIDGEVVAEHTTIVKNAAFVRVSRGTGE